MYTYVFKKGKLLKLQLVMLKCKYTFVSLILVLINTLGVQEYFLLLCKVYVKGGLS